MRFAVIGKPVGDGDRGERAGAVDARISSAGAHAGRQARVRIFAAKPVRLAPWSSLDAHQSKTRASWRRSLWRIGCVEVPSRRPFVRPLRRARPDNRAPRRIRAPASARRRRSSASNCCQRMDWRSRSRWSRRRRCLVSSSRGAIGIDVIILVRGGLAKCRNGPASSEGEQAYPDEHLTSTLCHSDTPHGAMRAAERPSSGSVSD